MKTMTRVGIGLCAAAWLACGGSSKETTEPTTEPVAEDTSESDDSEAMYPPEKLDEIQRTFENKRAAISRCHPDAVEAGELQDSDVVNLTVGLVIGTDGKPRNVRIVQADKKSPALEACVKEKVASWLLPTLPKDLEYSFAYRLGQL